jgi:excisionase family DNA binding protein
VWNHQPEERSVKLTYSVAETCEALSISRPTFYRLINAGELHALKIGSRTVVRADELERFLGSREPAA